MSCDQSTIFFRNYGFQMKLQRRSSPIFKVEKCVQLLNVYFSNGMQILDKNALQHPKSRPKWFPVFGCSLKNVLNTGILVIRAGG